MPLMDMQLASWIKVLCFSTVPSSCIYSIFMLLSNFKSVVLIRHEVWCYAWSAYGPLWNSLLDDDAVSLLPVVCIFLPNEHEHRYSYALAPSPYVSFGWINFWSSAFFIVNPYRTILQGKGVIEQWRWKILIHYAFTTLRNPFCLVCAVETSYSTWQCT